MSYWQKDKTGCWHQVEAEKDGWITLHPDMSEGGSPRLCSSMFDPLRRESPDHGDCPGWDMCNRVLLILGFLGGASVLCYAYYLVLSSLVGLQYQM